jgi:hypothetical protein
MKFEITVYHTPQELEQAKSEINAIYDGLGPNCVLARSRLIEVTAKEGMVDDFD